MYGFFILFSLVFAGVGSLLISVDKSRQTECSETAQGRIVEIKKRNTIKGWRCAPVVEYLVNGEKVRKTSTLLKTSTNLNVGDSVVVHYSPRTGEMWIQEYDGHFTLMLGIIFFFAGAMVGILVVLAGILGIRGRWLKGVIIFFILGEGFIFLIGMAEGF